MYSFQPVPDKENLSTPRSLAAKQEILVGQARTPLGNVNRSTLAVSTPGKVTLPGQAGCIPGKGLSQVYSKPTLSNSINKRHTASPAQPYTRTAPLQHSKLNPTLQGLTRRTPNRKTRSFPCDLSVHFKNTRELKNGIFETQQEATPTRRAGVYPGSAKSKARSAESSPCFLTDKKLKQLNAEVVNLPPTQEKSLHSDLSSSRRDTCDDNDDSLPISVELLDGVGKLEDSDTDDCAPGTQENEATVRIPDLDTIFTKIERTDSSPSQTTIGCSPIRVSHSVVTGTLCDNEVGNRKRSPVACVESATMVTPVKHRVDGMTSPLVFNHVGVYTTPILSVDTDTMVTPTKYVNTEQMTTPVYHCDRHAATSPVLVADSDTMVTPIRSQCVGQMTTPVCLSNKGIGTVPVVSMDTETMVTPVKCCNSEQMTSPVRQQDQSCATTAVELVNMETMVTPPRLHSVGMATTPVSVQDQEVFMTPIKLFSVDTMVTPVKYSSVDVMTTPVKVDHKEIGTDTIICSDVNTMVTPVKFRSIAENTEAVSVDDKGMTTEPADVKNMETMVTPVKCRSIGENTAVTSIEDRGMVTDPAEMRSVETMVTPVKMKHVDLMTTPVKCVSRETCTTPPPQKEDRGVITSPLNPALTRIISGEELDAKELASQLQTASITNSILRSELSCVKEERDQLHTETLSMRQQMAHMDKIVADKEMVAKMEVNAQVTQLVQQEKSQQEKIDSLEGALQQLQDKMQFKDKQLEDVQTENLTLQQDLQMVYRQKEVEMKALAAKYATEDYKSYYMKSQQRVQEIEAQLREYENIDIVLHEFVQSQEAVQEAVKMGMEKLIVWTNTKETEETALRRKMEEWNRMKAEHVLTMEQNLIDYQRMEQENLDMLKDMKEERSMRQTLADSVEEMQSELSRAQNENLKLQDTIKNGEKMAEANMKSFEEKLAGKEQEVTCLVHTVESREEDLSVVTADRDKNHGLMEKYQRMLMAFEQRQQDTVSSAEDAREFYEKERESMQEEITETRQALTTSELELSRLQAETAGLQQLLDQRRDDYRILEEELDSVKATAHWMLLKQGTEISQSIVAVDKLSEKLSVLHHYLRDKLSKLPKQNQNSPVQDSKHDDRQNVAQEEPVSAGSTPSSTQAEPELFTAESSFVTTVLAAEQRTRSMSPDSLDPGDELRTDVAASSNPSMGENSAFRRVSCLPNSGPCSDPPSHLSVGEGSAFTRLSSEPSAFTRLSSDASAFTIHNNERSVYNRLSKEASAFNRLSCEASAFTRLSNEAGAFNRLSNGPSAFSKPNALPESGDCPTTATTDVSPSLSSVNNSETTISAVPQATSVESDQGEESAASLNEQIEQLHVLVSDVIATLKIIEDGMTAKIFSLMEDLKHDKDELVKAKLLHVEYTQDSESQLRQDRLREQQLGRDVIELRQNLQEKDRNLTSVRQLLQEKTETLASINSDDRQLKQKIEHELPELKKLCLTKEREKEVMQNFIDTTLAKLQKSTDGEIISNVVKENVYLRKEAANLKACYFEVKESAKVRVNKSRQTQKMLCERIQAAEKELGRYDDLLDGFVRALKPKREEAIALAPELKTVFEKLRPSSD